jgi:heme o synthase
MSTATQPLPAPEPQSRALASTLSRASVRLHDYAELIKARVTTLVVMTAWCGFYFGAFKSGVSSLSWGLLHALLGIGLVAGGTAALNECMEQDVDALMKRTSIRPLPCGRMSLAHATAVGLMMTLGGALYLGLTCNALTGWLALATSAVYLGAYTPLKKVHPICTFVGAFPGAMPGVLGWTAARGRLDWESLVLFAIVFLWQFPHFFSIAWLYREDYAQGKIRMLPVVEPDGRATIREILLYSLVLIPVSLLPSFVGMSGKVYLAGAAVLGVLLFWFGFRLAQIALPPTDKHSKAPARHLLQATVFYLPLLFALMMINTAAR